MYFPLPFTKIRVHFLTVICILALFYADSSVFTLEVLICAALHELGHIIAMKLFGVEIFLFDILPCGAVIHSDADRLPYKKEAIIALSGALAGVVSGIAALAFYLIFGGIHPLFFGVSNLFLSLVNLIPVKGLDGARALEAILSLKLDRDRAEKITARISFVSLGILAVLSLFVIHITQNNFSLLAFCVYLFICLFSEGKISNITS